MHNASSRALDSQLIPFNPEFKQNNLEPLLDADDSEGRHDRLLEAFMAQLVGGKPCSNNMVLPFACLVPVIFDITRVPVSPQLRSMLVWKLNSNVLIAPAKGELCTILLTVNSGTSIKRG